MKAVEILGRENCPCESGKKYQNCCKKRDFQWVRDEEGSIYSRVPVPPEARSIFDEAAAMFTAAFGRAARPDDPLFLAKYLYSDKDIERETVEAMGRAGIDPALVHAYRRTEGRLVTEENRFKVPQKNIDEWNNAVAEFNRRKGKPPRLSRDERAWQKLRGELDHAIIVFGYLLEYGGNEKHSPSACASKLVNVESYTMICATRSFKTLRSIRYLLEKDVGEDCLSLARSIYESYLRIAYAKSNPDNLAEIVDAVVGLKHGTHSRAVDKKGRQIVVDKSTGREYKAHVSNYRMAESSGIPTDKQLFTGIYEFLSEFTHPSFGTAHRLFGEDGTLDPLINQMQNEALLYSLYFACLVIDEVRLLPSTSDSAAADLRRVSRRIGKVLSAVIERHLKESGANTLLERLRYVGTRPRAL